VGAPQHKTEIIKLSVNVAYRNDPVLGLDG